MLKAGGAETLYLIDLSCRLNFLRHAVVAEFELNFSTLLKQLQSLYNSLESSR